MGVSAGLSFGGETTDRTTSGGESYQTAGFGKTNGAQGASGGFNANSGRFSERTTVLTSLTSGGTADINVGGATTLIGATIGTVDANGNDLGNLNLTTGTFEFEDLSNRSYSNQVSAGFSSNLNLGNNTTTDAPPSARTTPDGTRLGTVSANFANSTSTDASTTVATIGQGNFTIVDPISSDDTARLNRDTGATEVELFNEDRSVSVDLTLDTRLLTEEGRSDIAEDHRRAANIIGAVSNLITDESTSLLGLGEGQTSLNEAIGVRHQLFNAAKSFVNTPSNAEYVRLLTDGNATPEQKQVAYQQLVNYVSGELGITADRVKVLLQLNDSGQELVDTDGSPGARSDETDTTYVAVDTTRTTGEATEVLGHEISHARDGQQDPNTPRSQTYSENREEFANRVGETLTGLLRSNYNLNDISFDAINNNVGGNENNALLSANNEAFNNEDPNDLSFYNEAGHYYTTYYTALRVGVDPEEARGLAIWSQIPDEVGDLDAITNALKAVSAVLAAFAVAENTNNPQTIVESFENAEQVTNEMERIQQTLHALTGGDAGETTDLVKDLIKQTESTAQKGLLLHLLADTFAHRTLDDENVLYPTGRGHLFDETEPDLIHERPELYLKYVKTLAEVLNPASSVEEGQTIGNELLGAVNDAVESSYDTITYTHETDTYPEGFTYQQLNGDRAADNTTTEIGNITRTLAEESGGIVDRPENNDLPLLHSRTIEEDLEHLKLEDFEINADDVRQTVDEISRRIREGQNKKDDPAEQ